MLFRFNHKYWFEGAKLLSFVCSIQAIFAIQAIFCLCCSYYYEADEVECSVMSCSSCNLIASKVQKHTATNSQVRLRGKRGLKHTRLLPLRIDRLFVEAVLLEFTVSQNIGECSLLV